MADATVTQPAPYWWPLIMGLLPSFNQILLVLGTGAVTLGGTLMAQNWTQTKAVVSNPITVMKTMSMPSIGPSRLDTMEQRLSAIEAAVATKTRARAK